jgi:tRNA (cmo5U34)-methyltransferase
MAKAITRPKPIDKYFDAAASGYEDQMRRELPDFDGFYAQVAACFKPSDSRLKILDLGCGTGLELESVWSRLPNAQIVGVDMSLSMLEIVLQTYRERRTQLTVSQESFLIEPLGDAQYDCIMAVLSLHYILPQIKQALYAKIHKALSPGGHYVEGAWIVSAAEERDYLKAYVTWAEAVGLRNHNSGHFHVNLPSSLDTNLGLLHAAGFEDVNVQWESGEYAVFSGRRH